MQVVSTALHPLGVQSLLCRSLDFFCFHLAAPGRMQTDRSASSSWLPLDSGLCSSLVVLIMSAQKAK